jgi:hypothetical protein
MRDLSPLLFRWEGPLREPQALVRRLRLLEPVPVFRCLPVGTTISSVILRGMIA